MPKISIRLPAAQLRAIKRKSADADVTIQKIGSQLLCEWAETAMPGPEAVEITEEDRMIAALESMIRKPRNAHQQAAKDFIIGILKNAKGALDQQSDEEDTTSQ